TPMQPSLASVMSGSGICYEGSCVSDVPGSGSGRNAPDESRQVEASVGSRPSSTPERQAARPIAISDGEWVLPVTGFVSDSYNTRGQRHKGVDICTAFFFEQTEPGTLPVGGKVRGPTNIPVVAAANGVVG